MRSFQFRPQRSKELEYFQKIVFLSVTYFGKMAKFMPILSLLCGVIPTLTLVSGFEVVLDVENHDTDEWAIGGQSVYAQTGKVLRTAAISQNLPENFRYQHFDSTRGIWIIFPNNDKDCAKFGNNGNDASIEWGWKASSEEQHHPDDAEHDHDDDHHHRNETSTTTKRTPTTQAPSCDISNFASFQCKLSAQLLSSIQVWYNFGGNASIRVTGGMRQHPFVVHANNMPTANSWVQFKVENLSGNKVLVEAIVNATGDYILIDKIIVETLEAPTTHRPTRHTTSRGSTTTNKPTEPSPTSSSSTIQPTGQPTHGPSPPSSGQSGMLTMLSGNMIVSSNLVTIIVIMKSFLL